MKKSVYLTIALFVAISIAGLAYADTVQFNINLSPGSTNTAEVAKLQQFLIDHGFLKVPATGNYLSLTKQAVADFQTSQGISPIGIFGPLTRAAANAILVTVAPQAATPTAAVSTESISTVGSNTATAVFSNQRIIRWTTKGYPDGVGVGINLMKKVSDSPKQFQFVKQIVIDTPNTGEYIWTPLSSEVGSNMYVEVVCSKTYQFSLGCTVGGDPVKVN